MPRYSQLAAPHGFAAAALALALLMPCPARADRIDDVVRVLQQSSKEKSRISAAVALGRTGQPRAVEPLLDALRDDPSPLVRAVVAAALGELGELRAEPALREALRDPDPEVRRAATQALARLAGAKPPRPDNARLAGRVPMTVPASQPTPAHAAVRLPAGEPARAAAPAYYVSIASVADQIRDSAPQQDRAWRTARVREYMTAELSRTPTVTLDAAHAQALGLRRFKVDVQLLELDRRVRGRFLEVECRVRLSVSNGRGKLLSFLTGGATVQVPARTFSQRYERRLREEAMENAARTVHQDLVAYLANEMRL